MRRILTLFPLFLLLAAIVGAPVALAADEDLPHSGRVLMAFGGDIALPVGEQADVVFVVNGDADIAGTVNTLTVIEGTATLHGATVENVVIVSGTLALEEGTTVTGNVRSIESTVTQAEGVADRRRHQGPRRRADRVGRVPRAGDAPVRARHAPRVAGRRSAPRRTRVAPGSRGGAGHRDEPLTGLRDRSRGGDRDPRPGHRGHGHDRRCTARHWHPARLPSRCWRSSASWSPASSSASSCWAPARNRSAARPYRGAAPRDRRPPGRRVVPFVGGLVTAVASILGLGAILLLGWRTLRERGTGETTAPQGASRADRRLSAPIRDRRGMATVPGDTLRRGSIRARWTEVGDRVFVRRYDVLRPEHRRRPRPRCRASSSTPAPRTRRRARSSTTCAS